MSFSSSTLSRQRLQRQLTVTSPPSPQQQQQQLWESSLFLGDTPVSVFSFFFKLTSHFLLPAMDCGSKYKLLTAAGRWPGLWSSPILMSDLRVGAAGLRPYSGSVNTILWSTVPVLLCMNSTSSWVHVTVQLWKYLYVWYTAVKMCVCLYSCDWHTNTF